MEAIAKHDFIPTDPEQELPLKKGDKLLILNYGDEVEWYNAQKDGQFGIVPGNYIDLEKADWYLGRLSRATAEIMLQKCSNDGAFLVRLSESSPVDFSLSVKCGDSVQHFRILKNNDNRYFLWQESFISLNELVSHYRKESVSRNNPVFLRDMDYDQNIYEALYDFEPAEDQELGFRKGDLITVTNTNDPLWWCGRLGDREGYIPASYVQRSKLPFRR